MDIIYAVMGYSSDPLGDGIIEACLMGCFSTEDLAHECGEELIRAGVIKFYEIEEPRLDEFGYK